MGSFGPKHGVQRRKNRVVTKSKRGNYLTASAKVQRLEEREHRQMMVVKQLRKEIT